jgi:hypothetical protein
MNDFVNQFWNWYVILLVLVSIIACGVLLWMQSVPPRRQARYHRPCLGRDP